MNTCDLLLYVVKNTPMFWFDVLFVVLCVSVGMLLMWLIMQPWIWRNK